MASSNPDISAALIQGLESIGSKVSFSAGERIQSEGEPGKGIYLLRSGSAAISMTAHDGEIIALRTLQSGAFVGLSSTLSCDHCCYSAQAVEPCEFTFVPADKAREFLKARTSLCLQVIQLLGHEMSTVCNERAVLNARVKPVKITA
jgi:CRP-like cAMP-binding protein